MKESREDYLEAIYTLYKTNPNVRAIDIANHLNFSRASVSRAIKLLANDGLIEVNNSIISLTKVGAQHANIMVGRHSNIKNLLVKLGVSEATADKDACRIEHVLSEETVIVIENFMKDNEWFNK